jgi:hypothetical protein
MGHYPGTVSGGRQFERTKGATTVAMILDARRRLVFLLGASVLALVLTLGPSLPAGLGGPSTASAVKSYEIEEVCYDLKDQFDYAYFMAEALDGTTEGDHWWNVAYLLHSYMITAGCPPMP